MSALRKLALRSILALAAAAAATGGTAVQAQDPPPVVSPLRVETDVNGVNLVTGRTEIDTPALSVPAAPNLRFDRVQNAAPYIRGTVQTAAPEGGLSSAGFSVHTGMGSSESFRCLDFDCTSVTGTGSILFQNSRQFRQGGTGAVWTFDVFHSDSGTTTTPRTLQYYASRVEFPTGESLTYTYEDAFLPGDTFNRTFRRPIRIQSNLGFHITIDYAGDTLGTMDWNRVSEAAIYNSAAPTVPLGRLTYLDDGTIRDLGGRDYVCSGCNNSLGTVIETSTGSLRLPGESTPAYEATPASGLNLVGQVVRDGVAWTYSYAVLGPDGSGGHVYSSVTVTGPNGYRRVYRMRQQERRNILTSLEEDVRPGTPPVIRTTDYEFDAAYRPRRVIHPDDNQVVVDYDEQYGNIVSRTTSPRPNMGLGPFTETATYPTETCGFSVRCYRPTVFRDGLGRETRFTYNDAGQLTDQIDPADIAGVSRETHITYEMAGISRRTSVRVCGTGAACATSAEIRTEYEYWGGTLLPSLERRIDAARGVELETRYTYDAAGRLLSTDGPLAGADDASYNRYDIHGRLSWEIGPRGANGLRVARRHSYRAADDKVTRIETGTVTDPASTTLTPLSRVDYVYDGRRNPVQETVRETVTQLLTAYSLTQRTFDDSNRVECEAVRMNRAAYTALPASACTLGPQGTGSTDFGPDRITRYEYDSAGQLTRERRAWGTPLQQDYATYEYSANGRRTSVTDANGNRAEMTYDGHDRLRRWIFPSRTVRGQADALDHEEYGYDLIGNRISLRKRDGSTISWQYDALNRMILKLVPERTGLSSTHTRDVHYRYDVRDLMTSARFDSASGEGVTNAYDGFGRLVSSSLNMNGVSRQLGSEYDAAGNRTRLTHPGGPTYRYDYDAAGRLTDLYEGTGTSVPLHHFTYTARGQVDVRTEGVGSSVDYDYDRIGRLKSQTDAFVGGTGNVTSGFTHNPASQIFTRTRSNDSYASNTAYAVDRSYSVNGLNQYTAAGPATFTHDANGNLTSDGSTTFTYDVENRLVGASGAHTAALRYDPLGRLYEVTGASGTRRFLWDGDALVAEYQTSGALAARFVHGTGAGDDPLIWRGGGVNRRLHADHQGSIVAITDGTGALWLINAYDPWGIPNATNAGRFQYTGQIWIGELGMYHYKARIYSPTLGRFLQTDPIGYDDQVNLYTYVRNDPVNLQDPTGEFIPPEGMESERTFIDANRELGRRIAMSPTRVDDVALFTAVALMATPVAMLSAPQAGAATTRGMGMSAMARGCCSEARVLQSMGLQRNTTAVSSAEGRSIPDALTAARSYEIKDSIAVSMTQQLRIQAQAALQSGRQPTLVTGTHTRVSREVARRFQIFRRADLGPQVVTGSRIRQMPH